MDAGYDAIAYRSKFGENGYNISVFDIDAAEILDCTPYEVTKFKCDLDRSAMRVQEEERLVLPSCECCLGKSGLEIDEFSLAGEEDCRRALRAPMFR